MFTPSSFCFAGPSHRKSTEDGESAGACVTYLTDMENSPGALSLSRTRKAPHSRCLKRPSATFLEMRPANHLKMHTDRGRPTP